MFSLYKSKKREKVTEIYFNEYDPTVTVITHKTSLKKRLEKYSACYPELCKLVQSDDEGGAEYEIMKDRISFRLLPPCSESRKEKARKLIEKINSKGGDSM